MSKGSSQYTYVRGPKDAEFLLALANVNDAHYGRTYVLSFRMCGVISRDGHEVTQSTAVSHGASCVDGH